MNTIRELKQQEKYKNMLKRKNKEKNIYKTQNQTLRIKYEGIKKLLEKKDKEIERLKKSEKEALDTLESATYENIDLTNEVDRLNNIINELKWKPIEEYDKGNYDWVLVKYFDGDYECVPCVAEKRFGKWHSIDEKEIQFDVRYFMDMQQIDKLQELKGEDK